MARGETSALVMLSAVWMHLDATPTCDAEGCVLNMGGRHDDHVPSPPAGPPGAAYVRGIRRRDDPACPSARLGCRVESAHRLRSGGQSPRGGSPGHGWLS